jgi:hypothetical protein
VSQQKLQIAIVNAAETKRKVHWGEEHNGFKVYACHQAQLDVLASKRKFTFAIAGTGGGKTCLIPLWLFKRVSKKPNGRFLVVSPSVNTFNSSQLKQHLIQTFAGTIFEGEWKDSLKTYRFPTGGEIVVKTVGDGGDYQKLVGGQYDAVAADECYFLSEAVWDEIRNRGGQQDCPILCVTTPNGNNWIFDVKQQADKGDPDYYFRQWGSAMNPTYSKEHLDRERKIRSAAQFARMYEGEFSAFEGLVYDCFGDPNAPEYPVITADALPSKPVRFFGCNDWGYSPDPAAFLLGAQCEDGCYYLCDEIYGTEIAPDDLARRVRAMIDKWAVRVDSQYADFGGTFTTIWTDVSRPEHTQHFRQAGISIRNKRVADVLAGIANVDTWFRSGRLKILKKNCPNLIRELRGYQWDTNRTGTFKDKPRQKDDHACDAIRYGISSHLYGETPTPIEAKPELNEAAERQKLERYGVNAAAIDEQMKEDAERKEKERLTAMAFGTADDDDPYGVWQSF